MTLVKVQIKSVNHYQLLKKGEVVEVIEYGPFCPKMDDRKQEYEGKRLLAILDLGDEIIWESDPGGTRPDRLYIGGKVSALSMDEEILCGDDFVYDCSHIEDKTRWKLWVDDDLFDPDQVWRHCPDDFLGAMSVREAQELVEEYGPPYFMDLDCDLGEGGRVIDFLKKLQEEYPENPPSWNVHSMNIVAAPAVDSFMTSWHKVARS